MKKILLLLFIAFSGSISAQVFSEDFQGGIPGTWTLIDDDGLTPDPNVAQFTSAWIGAADFDNTADTVAMSTSWYSPPGTSDDWMITPQINLTTNNVLTWEEEAQDANYPDGYEVRISTTTPTTAGFLANPAIYSTPSASGGVWTTQTVDLQAAGYMSQPVYLAWRNTANNQFILMIDDITIAEILPFNVSMTNASMIEYTQIPLSQVTSMVFEGTIDNIGSNAVSNVNMTANVYDGTMANVYTGTGTTMPSLASGMSTNISTTTGFTPLSADTYTVELISSMTEVDGDMTNDTALYQFIVSDSVFARDDSLLAGTLGIGAGNGGQLGQQFVLNTPDDLTTVSFFMANTGGLQATEPIWASIYSYANGAPDTLIADTDTIFIGTTANSWWTVPIQGNVLSLPADTFVVVINEFDSITTIGYSNNLFTPTTTWLNWPTITGGTWDNNESYNFNVSYLLRPNFGESCFDPTVAWTQVPNGSLTHDFTDGSTVTGTATYLWDLGDGNTSTLQNPSHTYAVAGTYTVCLTVTDSCGTDSTCMTVVSAACPDPIAAYGFTSNFLQTDFTDMSTTNGSTVTYLWDLGDGNTSTLQNPSHTYAAAGNYVVCLTVMDSCATDSVCQTVMVQACGPTVAFSSSNVGADYTFTDGSTVNGTATYLWDFGDGNSSATQSPLHTYTANGNYSVCLTVTDSCATDSVCQTVAVTGLSIFGHENSAFKLYPNPTTGQVIIDNFNGLEVNSISVLDINGRQIKVLSTQSSNSSNYRVDLNEFENGLYFIRLIGKDWSSDVKVIKN